MAVVSSVEAGHRAVELGATVLQLRAPAATAREIEEMARELVACRIPAVISSRCDIASAVGAAGVNLPEKDIPVAEARRLLGAARLVGRSVHSQAAAVESEQQGADYVVFGPVWASPTHSGAGGEGLDALAQIARAVSIPVLAIGGVTRERIAACIAAGARGYAAIRLFS